MIDLMNHKAGFQDTYFIQTTDIADTKSLEDALECHKHGDLTAIRIIFEIVGSEEVKDETTTSPADSLEKEATRLETLVESVQKDIEKIKSTEPYIWQVYLYDENKKNEKLNELEREIENFENAIRTQEEYIRELLGDSDE